VNFLPEDGEDLHIRPILAGIFLLVVAGGVVDLMLDRPDDWLSGHVIFEVGMIVVSLAAAAYLGHEWYQASSRVVVAEARWSEAQAERDLWKERAGRLLEGLGTAVSEQFDDWGLTPAERETALMLLKGMSHKAMARSTGRSERTVRQHSVAVYRKAGLDGRAALAAFFLEGISLPDLPE